MTRDEVRSAKHAIIGCRPYFERISLGFAARLLWVRDTLKEDHLVLDELDYLEGLRAAGETKEEEQFEHPPLYPFWHKHWSAPRHIARNVGIRWALDKTGNRDLTKTMGRIAKDHGDDPDRWQPALVYELVIDGYFSRRAARRITGDWIVFARHGGKNYYLDLATHDEGKDPAALYLKLRRGSQAEFPLLFE